MSDKIFRRYPENSLAGPTDRPFYYGIRRGEEWEYFRIVLSSGTRVLSSDKILENNKFELPQEKKILVFETHSDDAGIFTGNFLLKLKRDGNQIHIVNLISCHLAVGGYLSQEEKKKIRDEEDREFAKKIEASIQFLRLEFPFTKIELKREADGFLDLKNCKFGSPGQADFEKVYQVLNASKPDVVLLPHPFDYHQMHRDTANLALAAIAKLSRQNNMRLLFYGSGHNFQRFGVTANIYNLLSREEAEKKTNLLKVFRSQIELFEGYVKRFRLQAKEVDEKELNRALCDFLVASLSGNELEKLNKEILHQQIESPYCERFMEFKVSYEAHLPG